MRSAQELDAELRRMHRSMRTVIAAVTFGTFVGVAVVVAVVGATLAMVDKNATQALKAGEAPRQTEQASRKIEQAKTEQAKSEQAKAEQAKIEQAKIDQAKTEQAKSEQAKPAQPPRAAAMDMQDPPVPAPAQTTGAASAEPIQAEPRKQAEEQKKADARKRIVRARPERGTRRPPEEPDVAARDVAGQGAEQGARFTDPPEPRDARPARRGYARVPDEDPANRVTVITTQRPRYTRPEFAERPAYDEREAPRDRGLFGALFGGRED